MILLVMGVAGAGKSTLGLALAERLGWTFQEGDDLHPAANREKMAAGRPLTDDDRSPWLAAIGAWMDSRIAAGAPGVISCSALKLAYRDRLRAGRPDVRVIFLDGEAGLIGQRLKARTGHFMPAALLDSQFAALERPTAGEGVARIEVNQPLADQVEAVLGAIS